MSRSFAWATSASSSHSLRRRSAASRVQSFMTVDLPNAARTGAGCRRRIEGICRDAGIALCGPNCMGVLSPHHPSTTYLQELRDPAGLAGNVGIVSQSGGFCIGLLNDVRRFGFSHVVSSGNEAVLAAADYLEYLVDDPHTKVIGGFIETVRYPDRFAAALDRAAAQGKPVVVLKVGRTERTQYAVATHTGGIAGDPGLRPSSFALIAQSKYRTSSSLPRRLPLPRAQNARLGAGSASLPHPAGWPS